MSAAFSLEMMRHSASHVMAAAIHQLWPETQFGVGPSTERGFYYDILKNQPLTQDDLEKVERVMRQIVKKKTQFVREEWPIEQAIDYMEKAGQPLKVELLKLLQTKGSTAVAEEVGDQLVADVGAGLSTVSIYKLGTFVDLCRGPHVENAGQIATFKLMSVAGAYWRGKSENQQLQRIHAFAEATQPELDGALWRYEEAKRRDHRRIGKDLSIFSFADEIGAGLPLWLPNGTIIRDELEHLARQEERKEGYQRVSTPHLTKGDVYVRSGHLPYYKDDMYAAIKINGDDYFLRPMNCPHHHHVFLSSKHSYRDMPVRIAEYGQVYRYEDSGALSGLMRVRGFCQNDAHIYVSADQAEEEFLKVMHLHARYYDLFDIKDYYMRLSLPDLGNLGKYVNQPEEWMKALEIIRSAMQRSGYPYKEVKGEAAFYGPKIDFMIKSAVGSEYAISTNQLDFLASKKFDLNYVGKDGEQHPVYVIHRAPLGSHERFVAFLLEHYAGALPVWLSPVQAQVIPIADRHLEYARHVEKELQDTEVKLASGGLRVGTDSSDERMQKKIRSAQQMKIPYMLIVGDQEAASGTVSVRLRSGQDLGQMPLEVLKDRMVRECNTRTDAILPDPAPSKPESSPSVKDSFKPQNG